MTKVYDLTKEGFKQFENAVIAEVYDTFLPALDNNDPIADEFVISVKVRGHQINIPMNADAQDIIFKAIEDIVISEYEM